MKFNIWNDYEYMDLPDVLSFIVDNRGKTVPTDDKGTHILIATNCIRNENLYPSYEKVRFLNEETYQNWFRAHPISGDIIFVNKGTPGRVCLVPDPVDFCIAQDMMAFRANPDIVYNKYLFAVLRSARIQNQISATTVGDVIPHFKKQHLHEIKIPIPPMEIQKLIGDYYFMFCEKIVVNNKINRNLQEQAKTMVYKWEKENKDAIVYCRLGDIARINPESYSAKDDWSFVNYLDTSSINDGRIDELLTFSIPDDKLPSRAKRKIIEGDIVYSTVRPNQLHYGIVMRPAENMLVSTGFAVIRSTVPYLSNEMIYSILSRNEVVEQLQQIAEESTSTFPAIKPSDLEECLMPCIKDGENTSLLQSLKDLYDLIASNYEENKRLMSIRDILLPKLMSGQIDVSDIDI